MKIKLPSDYSEFEYLVHVEDEVKLADIFEALVQRLDKDLEII